MHQTLYIDSNNITHFYDGSTFTPQIALYLPIFSFLYAKLFELLLKIYFSRGTRKKNTIFGLQNPREQIFLMHLDFSSKESQ